MSEEIQVVQVGAAGAALAQASAALALQYKNETSTLKGQVDTAKAAVDVAKAAVDTAKGQVDTAKAEVDVAKAAVDLSQADVIARQAIVVAAQATTEAARDVAVEQASEATEKAAEAAGNASLALAIFGTADNLNAAQQIMLGYANTAQGAASQAQASAASAASVAQQDLSGVTAASLHRSPNAVTAMCTSRNSDGGAWVERCTATSWATEALNGTWRGACSSEAACRAISGATTGDYFQLTTDGKFYKLNAGSGTTEVFRGNKAKPGRLSAPICEGARSTIYDLTETGCPAWMTFVAAASNMVQGTIAGAAMLNGVLALATNSGLFVVNLAADTATLYNTTGRSVYRGRVSQRNAALGHDLVASGAGNVLASNTVNAVSMCVMPDAPVDPVTGLQVPTIACATGVGISIIQNDGTVRNSSSTSAYTSVTITKDVLTASITNSSTMAWAQRPGNLSASFALTTTSPAHWTATQALYQSVGNIGRSIIAKRNGNNLLMLRHNEAVAADGLTAHITGVSNTGWMAGDIRRVWCADTAVGTGSSTEKVVNGTFSAGTTGWTVGANATVNTGSGAAVITATTTTNRALQQAFTVTPNAPLRLTYTASQAAGTAARVRITEDPSLSAPAAAYGVDQTPATTPTNYTFTFTPTTSTIYFVALPPVDGVTTLTVDDVSLTEVVADRCYKAKPATIYGTLARTAVAAAAQLVAYSGFSASNYIQEPYSAELDPGTASVTCNAWVNYATAVASTIVERAAASGARIVLGTDATGKLTATAHDGTTTRTVTTTAAYNTSTWLKARASYTTDGTLSISVNGRVVASAYGTPLLTLSNPSAVTTIGNDRTLATPFPGSLALVKWGATVPSAEAMLWMYEQEKQMFRAGAQVTLPDAGSLVDVAYDDLTDTVTTVSAATEGHFNGMVRTSTSAVPAGAFTKAARGSGVKLLARSTTNIGVDVTIPSQNLKEELLRAEDAARRARLPATFDYVGGFTANVTNGSTALASVTGLSVPSGVNLRGVTVTGTGIPASTVITDIVGSTVYISKAATATNTGVSISMIDFPLPAGYEAEGVAAAGALKQEGATKDWTRVFDGFVERAVFGAAPGATAWVQTRARRAA